jgi:hypothetical protein
MRQRIVAAQLAELAGHSFGTVLNEYAAHGSLDAMVAGPLPAGRANVVEITLPPLSFRASFA